MVSFSRHFRCTPILRGVGVLVDLLMLYTGNFTDAEGALVLPEYKIMLLQAIRQTQAAPAASAPGGAAPAEERRALLNTFPDAASAGVIKMNHVAPTDTEFMRGIDQYFSLGLHFDEDKIDELVVYEVRAGAILRSFLYSPNTSKPQDLVDFLGGSAVLVSYGLRAGFRAFAAILKDADANASWSYIDLQELPGKESVAFAQAPAALDRARNAIDYFEAYRAE